MEDWRLRKPASDETIAAVRKAVQDVDEHEHNRDDVYCLNLVAWMGERMGAVLARLDIAEGRRVSVPDDGGPR